MKKCRWMDRKVEISKEETLAVSEACMATYWPTPGFKGRTFKLCVLTRWDFNFCVRCSPLWEWDEAVSRMSLNACLSTTVNFLDKVSGWPTFNMTRCPDDAKAVGHQTCRKQILWLWTKQEKLKFTSLTISPGTAAVEWLLIMNLLSVQLYSQQWKTIYRMRSDRALYMATYFSQSIAPLWSACTGQHVCLLRWTEACFFVGK